MKHIINKPSSTDINMFIFVLLEFTLFRISKRNTLYLLLKYRQVIGLSTEILYSKYR